MQQLFCFDFDNTIVKGHFHNTIAGQGSYDMLDEVYATFKPFCSPITQDNALVVNGEVIGHTQNPEYDRSKVEKEAVKLLNEPDIGLRDAKKLKEVLKKILSQGHKIAITSFTKYPHVIPITLSKLGLTQEEIKDINIIGGFPKDGSGSLDAKTEHIEKAMELVGITNKAHVVLIDDSEKNITKAKQHGMSTVIVPKKGFQWKKVQDIINDRPILPALNKFAKQHINSDLSKKEWDQLDKNNLLPVQSDQDLSLLYEVVPHMSRDALKALAAQPTMPLVTWRMLKMAEHLEARQVNAALSNGDVPPPLPPKLRANVKSDNLINELNSIKANYNKAVGALRDIERKKTPPIVPPKPKKVNAI